MPVSLYSGPLGQVDEQFVDKAKSFADDHLKSHAEQWEQTKQQPEETLRMAISQFAGIRIPIELGRERDLKRLCSESTWHVLELRPCVTERLKAA